MAIFYEVVLQGNAKHDWTRLRFQMSTALYADALIDVALLRPALMALTNCTLKSETLSNVLSEDGTRPVAGINAFEEAVVTTYLDAGGEKLHTIRIPGPVPGLFLTDGETVIGTHADLITYVGHLSATVDLSDGESINLTTSDGIAGGYKRSKAKNYK